MSNKKDGGNSIDIKKAWQNLNTPKAKQPGQRVAEQEAAERQHTLKTDRRRTGRNTQMNLKVKEFVQTEIRALAKKRGITMGAMIEIILTEWKAKGGKE